MRDNKGFTLVELLAVIVILAIVALVTVPAILNVINNSRESGAEDSAWGVIDAVRLAYTQAQANGYQDSASTGITVSSGKITIDFGDGGAHPTFADGTQITYSGSEPVDGSVEIDTSTGTITCTDLEFTTNGTYTCTTDDGNTMTCTAS